MEIFNTHRLTQKQRFNAAVVVGAVASIVIGIATGYARILIGTTTGFDFSFVSIGAGYAIAYVLRKVGRGVQVKFSILGGILGFIAVSISNVLAFGFPLSFILNVSAHLNVWLNLFSGNLNTVLMLVYQVAAIYIAYTQSRIV